MQGDVDALERYQPTDLANLEVASIAATRLTAVRITAFKKLIERFVERLGRNNYFDEWLHAIEEGPEALRHLLVDASDRGQVLRSCVTLHPFFDQDELLALRRERFVVRAPWLSRAEN